MNQEVHDEATDAEEDIDAYVQMIQKCWVMRGAIKEIALHPVVVVRVHDGKPGMPHDHQQRGDGAQHLKRIDVLRAPSPMVARHSQLSDTLCLRKKC